MGMNVSCNYYVLVLATTDMTAGLDRSVVHVPLGVPIVALAALLLFLVVVAVV